MHVQRVAAGRARPRGQERIRIPEAGLDEFDRGVTELKRLADGGNASDGPFLEDPWRGARYPLVSALSRPPIVKHLVATARKHGATVVGHGSTGKGNDQVRFEMTCMAMEPGVKIIAPWRDPQWTLNTREKMVAYAKENGIPVPVTAKKPYSSDRNLLHISFEGGILEDPWSAPPDDMFVLSVSPCRPPTRPPSSRWTSRPAGPSP